MGRMFVMTLDFEECWKKMGLGDDELRQLQNYLSAHPDIGDVIPGLSPIRKVRISLDGRGKSGGGRVIYIDIVKKERIYLLLAYQKNQQVDLDQAQRKTVKRLADIIKRER